MIRKVSLLSLSMLMALFAVAQKVQYVVKVVDAVTGNPVSGASVKLKGTTSGSSADDKGSAMLSAASGDVIEVSSVGYSTQTITLGSSNEIYVRLDKVSSDLGDVVVLGSRAPARAKIETAVPVDVIKINQGLSTSGRMDFTSALNVAAPSFNYNKQSGSDGADNIDLGTLRGLGPDQTLVLINGKRRHQTAFIALFGTRGRGASGTDLNSFPQNAVDRIEILRDGASAQYGSDAIAGVMNIVLSKNVNKWIINTGWSGYNDTKYNAILHNANNDYYTSGKKIDGQSYNFNANNGFNIGKQGGFVNISFNFTSQDKTYRQVAADSAGARKDRWVLPFVNTGRRAFGDGSMTSAGIMYNMEAPIKGTKMLFYSFGGSNSKDAETYAYTRNVSARPDRFPVSSSGAPIFVPSIMRTTNSGEVFYNPLIKNKINDASLAGGIKGISKKNWKWDLSLVLGSNDFQFFGDQTFNASLIGNTTKNFFIDGGFRFRQQTLNYDVNKTFDKVLSGLNIAYGFEQRNERYTINKGEEASYTNYDLTGVQGTGSQGFPGYAPEDVVDAKRFAVATYADAELKVTEQFLVDAALRYENYSDFGGVLTYKLATRFKISDDFTVRASGSTGFRAPSLAQKNYSNTLTSFSLGQLVQSRIAKNGDAISRAAGIPSLKQETSQSLSGGFAAKTGGLTVTVDGYWTRIKDRVVLSGLFSAGDPTLPNSLNTQLQTLGVATAQFLSNAVNTTNYGVDVVVDYTKKWGKNSLKALFAANLQAVTIDQVNVPAALSTTGLNRKTFFSDREEAMLKASAPNQKATLSLAYTCGKFGIGLVDTYYGKMKTLGFGVPTAANPNYTGIFPQVPSDASGALIPEEYIYRGKMVVDLNLNYKFSNHFTFFAGVDNVFNAHPDLGVAQGAKRNATGNETGGPFESVQMNYNGRRYFTKLAFNF